MKEVIISYLAEAYISTSEINYTGPKNVDNLVVNVLNAVYFWAGVVSVGFIVYGGFMYVISAGEPGKLKKAKDTLLYAVVGIVVVLVAFTITRFVTQGV